MIFDTPVGKCVFPIKPISEGSEFISGYAFKGKDFVDVGNPVIKIKNIRNGKVTTKDSQYVSDEVITDKLLKFRLYNGDILIAMTGQGSVGRVGKLYVSDDDTPYLNQRVGKFVADEKTLNKDFLYYVISTQAYENHLFAAGSGSGQPNLSPAIIKSVEIPYPPYDVQCYIGETLKDIDDKIELNRQTNQNLENIAQAIFKSWFVDFEPTRAKISAKENGQDPERAATAAISGKTDAELDQLDPNTLQQLKTTAALFPDTLVYSELGGIPEGWEVKALDQLAHYQNGLALQKFRPENEKDFLPVLKISQLKKGFADGEEKASPNIKIECIVNNGDVVFSWSGSLLVDVWCGGKVALNQHLFKVTSEEYPKWFYYYWTKIHLRSFQQIAADKAVTMGHIKRSHLAEAKCAVPNVDLNDFNVIGELIEKQIEQQLENSNLEQLRNSLLPKLLSGELSAQSSELEVKDAN